MLERHEYDVPVFTVCAPTDSAGCVAMYDVLCLLPQQPKLGKYAAHQIVWAAGKNKVPFVTTTRNFADGLTVVFEQTFPQGAKGTSLVVKSGGDPDSYKQVIAQVQGPVLVFPSNLKVAARVRVMGCGGAKWLWAAVAVGCRKH